MASIFQSAEWKSAREYASDFAEQLKKDLPPPSDAVVWDSSYTSDHLPVTAMLPNESIALLSWNLCNSVWMKYQEAREDSGQRLYDHPAFAKENRESRLLAQKDYIEKQIVQHQNNGLIIFLQEVSPLMSLILEKCFDRTHHVLRFATNAKETNFNVTMLPRHNVTYNYVYDYGFSDKFKEFVNNEIPNQRGTGSGNQSDNICMRRQFSAEVRKYITESQIVDGKSNQADQNKANDEICQPVKFQCFVFNSTVKFVAKGPNAV